MSVCAVPKLIKHRDASGWRNSAAPHPPWCCRASVCAAAGYEQCAGKLLRLLERLVYLRDITPDYTYYGIASPWLQTKVLRALQYFPLPEGTGAQKQLHDVLQGIFNGE